MGSITSPEPVLLFVGLLFADAVLAENAEKELINHFGPFAETMLEFPFVHTNYYEHEMGRALIRRFRVFKKFVDPSFVVASKIKTNAIESSFAAEKSRRINIDPGYLDCSKVVLASTKNFYHRLYLGKGIYGELTLSYSRKTGFTALEWTYPDYAEEQSRKWFLAVRKSYYNALRSGSYEL